MLKSLLLHASAETVDPGSGPALYALGLARDFGAHLKAPVFELNVTSKQETDDLPSGASDVSSQKAAALRTAADDAGVQISVETERQMSFGVPDWLCDLGKLHDLTIAGVDGGGIISERQLAECLVFRSGRPVLLVPRNHAKSFEASRVIVAWDYSAPAARALAEALPFLRRATDITIATVGDDKDFMTSLEPGEVIEAMQRRGVRAEHREITRGSGRIGDVLQGFAADSGADLLVMGAFGHSRMRDFILGGATRGILEQLRLPTLLSH